MAVIKIAANSEQRVPTSARYLTIVSASAAFYAKNAEQGIKDFQLKQNTTVDTENVTFLTFVNNSNAEISVEYQVTPLRVLTGDTGSVEIVGTVTVDSIQNGVNVNASIGAVEILPANTFTEFEDITLSTNTVTLLLAADAQRKEVELFLHGDDLAQVRIGSSAISATKGRILTGGGGAIGSMTISGTDAIYALKVSGTNPKIAMGVEKRV